MARRRTLVGLIALALSAVAPGCAEELGPEPMETTRVTGVVLEGGRPVRGGWIEFVPVEGTVGNMRSAPIGPGGRFTADRVPVGTNRIGLVAVPFSTLPRGMFDTLGSQIERQIPPGLSSSLTLDVIDEAVRLRANQGRG
jgi:hypothetical protein